MVDLCKYDHFFYSLRLDLKDIKKEESGSVQAIKKYMLDHKKTVNWDELSVTLHKKKRLQGIAFLTLKIKDHESNESNPKN